MLLLSTKWAVLDSIDSVSSIRDDKGERLTSKNIVPKNWKLWFDLNDYDKKKNDMAGEDSDPRAVGWAISVPAEDPKKDETKPKSENDEAVQKAKEELKADKSDDIVSDLPALDDYALLTIVNNSRRKI